jgi:hypothetical protein
MKMIKNSALLFGTILIAVSGCANVESSPLYSAWQNQAYGAYGMSPPAPQSSPFMNTMMPPQTGYTYRPVSQPEQRYVASYYGLN